MKKVFALIGMALVIFTSSVYGSTPIESSKSKNQKVYSRDERIKLISSDEFDITIDGQATNKKITINKYIPSVGSYVSLRELVNALGGTIEWDPYFNDKTENESDGTLERQPYYTTKYLGKFSLLGTEYKYYTYFKWGSYEDKETYLPIVITTQYEGKECILPMNAMVETLATKLVDNKIYIPIDALRKRILPRMGYLCNINEEELTFNIKKYDFEKEKALMLNKFPIDQYPYNKYAKEYDNIITDTDGITYFINDIFDELDSKTSSVESKCLKYIDEAYRPDYDIFGSERVLKNYLQAVYLQWIDEEINIEYDNDLEAYIVSSTVNKEDTNEVRECEIVVRKYDNMVLLVK